LDSILIPFNLTQSALGRSASGCWFEYIFFFFSFFFYKSDSSSEKEDQIVAQELALSSHYRGWPNFPRKMASSISTRQKLLKMRSVTSTEEAGPLVARQPQPKQHKEARNRRLVRRGKVSPMRPSAETAPPATQCRCVHKSILNCLLPAVFQDTLNDLEIIRRQLKATRLRRHKLPRPTGS